MASYTHRQLTAFADRWDREQRREREPWLMEEVDAASKVSRVRATRIGRESTGTLIFEDEVATVVRPGQEVELRLRDHPPELPVLAWRSFEVATPAKGLAEHHAVIASYPYCTDWVDCDLLRRSGLKHYTVQELDSDKRRAIEAGGRSADGHIEYLRRLTYDLFETRRDWRTARLDGPQRTEDVLEKQDVGSISARRRWNSRAIRLPEFRQGDRYRKIEESWVFGLCDDPGGCVSTLMANERVDGLLRQSASGELLKAHCSGTPPLRPRPLVSDAQKMAPKVMEASCRWALAGPAEGLGKGNDTRLSWVGRPVVDLVQRIFVRVMYALNARLSGSTELDVASTGFRSGRRANRRGSCPRFRRRRSGATAARGATRARVSRRRRAVPGLCLGCCAVPLL